MSHIFGSVHTDVESGCPSFSEKFGDPSSYHMIQRDPLINHDREIKPVMPGQRWTKADYNEFEYFLNERGFKMKTVFDNGRIFITEVQTHSAHEACSNLIVAPFHHRNLEHYAINGDDLFFMDGTTRYDTTIDYSVTCDQQVEPNLPDAESPTLFVEVASTQTVGSAFARVKALLRGSPNLRYMLIVKIYQSPVPMDVAMTACVWEKDGDTAEGEDWIATRFVSFGNRQLTEVELEEYPAAEMDTDHAQLNAPVVNFLEEQGGSAQIHPLTFTMSALFDLPNQAAPADIAATEDVVVDLVMLRSGTVLGIVRDIMRGRWVLNNDELFRIIEEVPADPTHRFARLRQHALTYCVHPVLL